jgi:hypothetical protein
MQKKRKTITNRNAGYAGLKLAATKFVFVRLALDSTVAAKLSRGADEAALSRWGKPAFPARTPPGSALPGPAVPAVAFFGFSVDSSRLSLFGRRLVNPDPGLERIASASPRRG